MRFAFCKRMESPEKAAERRRGLWGALGISLLTARRRSAEVHALHFFEGACPRCGKGVSLSQPVHLRHPDPIFYPSCQYELALSVDL